MDLIFPQIEFENNTWLDQRIETDGQFRLWHVGLMGFGVFLSIGEGVYSDQNLILRIAVNNYQHFPLSCYVVLLLPLSDPQDQTSEINSI